MCHLVLLLPLFGLPVFWLWPPAVAVPIYLVVVAVSAGVYYLTFVALRLPVTVGSETLAGTRGQVVSVESGELRVRVQSEMWRASASERLSVGDPVEVQGIDGLTLNVRRAGIEAGTKRVDQRARIVLSGRSGRVRERRARLPPVLASMRQALIVLYFRTRR